MTSYYERNKLKILEKRKEYYLKNKIKINSTHKKYRDNHKIITKCHDILKYDKKINPDNYSNECCICGSNENVDYHHPEYNFALSVYPMCRSHHLELHSIK